MKLYNHSQAPNPRRVRIFMAEKGISLPMEEIDLMAGKNRAPEFLAKNPSGGLPVLELDDGGCIAESVAICRYLEGQHPEPNLMGRNPREQAEIEMWNRRMELELFGSIGQTVRNTHPMFKERLRQFPEYGEAQRAVTHLGPVLDDLADITQHAAQAGLDGLQVLAVGLAVDLDVHPGLDGGVGRPVRCVLAARAGVDVQDLQQLAGDVTADQQLGVDDDVDAAVLAGQLVGDRVDEEGHVVGDDLHDRVPRGPAVLVHGRREDPDPGCPLRTGGRQFAVRVGSAGHVDGISPEEVLRGHPTVVAMEERRVLGIVEHARRLRRAVYQVSLGVVELAEHRRSHH